MTHERNFYKIISTDRFKNLVIYFEKNQNDFWPKQSPMKKRDMKAELQEHVFFELDRINPKQELNEIEIAKLLMNVKRNYYEDRQNQNGLFIKRVPIDRKERVTIKEKTFDYVAYERITKTGTKWEKQIDDYLIGDMSTIQGIREEDYVEEYEEKMSFLIKLLKPKDINKLYALTEARHLEEPDNLACLLKTNSTNARKIKSRFINKYQKKVSAYRKTA
ncbi:hypothetical protein ACYSNU_13885 [Enterococcus sp. LJL120]